MESHIVKKRKCSSFSFLKVLFKEKELHIFEIRHGLNYNQINEFISGI